MSEWNVHKQQQQGQRYQQLEKHVARAEIYVVLPIYVLATTATRMNRISRHLEQLL